MRKKVISILLTLVIVVGCMTTVNAATTATVTLTASKTQVEAGKTFTVTLVANCEDGINGLDTTYSYSSDVLELVSGEVADSNWGYLGTDNSITVICNSTSKIKSANVYVLTFKVKEGATVGSKAEVSTTSILLDSDSSDADSSVTIDPQKVEITVVETSKADNTGTGTGTSGAGTTGSGKSGTGATGSTGTGKSGTSSGSKQTTSGSTSKSSSADSTTAKSSTLPQTGNSTVTIVLIVGATCGIIAIVSFVGYRKYRKI